MQRGESRSDSQHDSQPDGQWRIVAHDHEFVAGEFELERMQIDDGGRQARGLQNCGGSSADVCSSSQLPADVRCVGR